MFEKQRETNKKLKETSNKRPGCAHKHKEGVSDGFA